MAWTVPMTAVANSVFTAAQFNSAVRDNLLETAPAKATTAGRLFVATGTNQIAERAAPGATVATIQTTTNSSFTDLTTPGPAVTLDTGSIVIVILSAFLANNTAGSNAQMGVAVTGASSVSPNGDDALVYESSNNSDLIQCSYVFPIIGLTPGSNTFTAKYLAGTSGTASFGRRRVIVLPFGS